MKLNYLIKNKRFFLGLIFIILLLSLFLVKKLVFKPDPKQRSSSQSTQSEQIDANTDIRGLTQRSKAKIPEVESRNQVMSVPKDLSIYLNPEIESYKVESLNFKNGTTGYSMEFNLGYSLVSSLNYFLKVFNDNSIDNLYGGFGDYASVLYGDDKKNYIFMTFVKINDNNTKINIQKYAH